jgi:hypothetical protein
MIDNISKISKNFSLTEYITEEARGATMKAMNGEVAAKCRFADSLHMTSIYLLCLYIYVVLRADDKE